MILANGAVCGVVGICTSSTFSNYQFQLTGIDGNSHTLTFDSPLLQFGARPAGQSIPFSSWPSLGALTPRIGKSSSYADVSPSARPRQPV